MKLLRKSIVIANILFIIPSFIEARVIEINSRNRLFARINESFISVVQFYCYDRKNKNCCHINDYKDIKSRFNAVSQNNRYRRAEIDFILMNCNGEPCIAQEFGFSTMPALMIFVNGMPEPGARINGFVHECDINALIERYLSNDINDIIDQKIEDKERAQEAQIAAWTAWGPYWNCGYGYGCYRPYGFGFYGNWGGGCCW